jgi:hypothetical protein
MALLLFAGLVFVAGWAVLLAVIVFGYRGGINNGGLPAEMPPVALESQEEKQAELRSGFGSDAPAVDAATRQEFQAYFDKLAAALKEDNGLEYAKLIDLDRFMREIKKTGLVSGMTRKEERAQLEKLRLEPPGLSFEWERMAIAGAKMLDASKQEAVVYAYFWNTTDFALEYRVWLVRFPTGWRAYDWELVPYGFRSSFETAACIKRARDPRLNDYFASQRDIASADQKEDAGDRDAAIRLLQQAEKRARIPELADRQLIGLAYAWWRAGRIRDGLRCAAEVSRPGAVPGALFLQATLYDDLRQYRRAAEFGHRCEEAAGGGPAVWQLLANIYDRLGDRPQAARYWRKVLQFDFENVATLQSLATQLEPADTPALIDALRRAKRPAELAAELAERLAWTTDSSVIEAVSEFVAAAEPDSARAAYVAGLAAENDGDVPVAAGFFKTAFQRETDADRKTRYATKFLDAMVADEQALAGYEQAPDAEAAFAHLLSDDDDESSSLSAGVRQALIDAHRQKFPDSPELHYHAGRLLQEAGDDGGAERELRAALAAARDDDGREQYRGALVALLRQAGREIEAYQTVPPPGDTFRQLVQAERWAERTGKVEALKELHRLHHAAQPGDGWLEFCQALIQKEEKNAGEAHRLAFQGYERATDPALKTMYQWLVVDVAVPEGEFAAATCVFPDPETALERLGQRFSSLGEWDRLQGLLDWHRRTHAGPSPAARRLQVIYSWNQNDFGGVVAAIEAGNQPGTAGTPAGDTPNFDDWYVRSLLNVGRPDDARRKAQAVFEQDARVIPLLLVSLAEKNVDEVERLMAEGDLQQYELENLYDDPDTGPVLYSPLFQQVRQKFPLALSYWLGSSSAVLLVREAPKLTAESLKTAVAAALAGECTIELLDPVPGNSVPGRSAQWLIISGTTRLVVSRGSAPCHDDADYRRNRIESVPLNEALNAHQGWIEIEQVDSARARRAIQKGTPEYLRLAAALLTDDCLAVCLPMEGRIIENSAELRQSLTSENPREAMLKLGAAHWLRRASEGRKPGENQRAREFQRSLKRMIEALKSRRDGQSFEIGVALHFGSVTELLHVDVDEARSGGYRMTNFVGPLRRPSKFLPRLVTGERLSVPQYLVSELSYGNGEHIERARRHE